MTQQNTDRSNQADPRNAALMELSKWDPAWAETCMMLTTAPWTNGILPRKTVELVRVALDAASATFSPDSTRQHIRAALEAGATRDEILLVLKMASVMSIGVASVVVPFLLEEATESDLDAAAEERAKKLREAGGTPTIDWMKKDRRWNVALDPFYELAPVWIDQFMSMAAGVYSGGVLPIKDIELLGIALEASYTHMDASGMRRHLRNALRAGATVEEIMAVLKLCMVQGVEACNLRIPILAEQLPLIRLGIP
jgi:alkylhydroperoxidase/carboxymuconolactone decarboxylase family protein YurZ